MPSASEGTMLGRNLRRRLPWAFKKCPAGLMHPRWDQVCYCRIHEHAGDWHGGIYDFRMKREINT